MHRRTSIGSLVLLLAMALVAPGLAAQLAPEGDRKEALKHHRAGKEALQGERFEEAETEFRLAIKADPLLVGAHYGLGQTLMATKRFKDAVPAFLGAREAFGKEQALASGDQLSRERRIDDQIKALQDDVNAAQRSSSGSNATRISSAIDRNQEQIKTLQAMKKRGQDGPLPTPHWLSFALGSAYFRAGDLVNAEAEYRSALAQKADLGEAHLNLAVVSMLQGRLDEAEAEVARAEKAGVKVPQGLKDDLAKRRGAAAKP